MLQNTLNFLALALPLLIFVKVVWDTRGVCFFTGENGTDNEKMVRLAQEVKFFQWPSRMHQISYGRGQLREYWVLCLKFVGLFFKNKITDHVNVVLSLLANLGSCYMVYYLGSVYWGPKIGAIVSLLYTTSLWSYQVAIYMGHIHLAQFFFLCSLAALSNGIRTHLPIYYVISGALCAVSFFSSSASRKYPYMYLGAFLVLHWGNLSGTLALARPAHLLDPQNIKTQFTLAALSLLTLQLAASYLAAPTVLRIIKNIFRRPWNEEKLISLTDRLKRLSLKVFSNLTLLVFAHHFLANDLRAIQSFGWVLFGVAIPAVHILGPKLYDGYQFYLHFLNIGVWANHFKKYKAKEQEIFGREIPDGFRGAGLPWVPRFFSRVMPVPFFLFTMSCVLLLVWSGFGFISPTYAVVIIGLSLIPTAVSEQTKSLQVGKSYYPSLLGILIAVGFAMSEINYMYPQMAVAIGIVAVLIQAGHSVYNYLNDVLPARMAPTHLMRYLRERGYSEFATYDIPYNHSLVKTMAYSYPNEFKIKTVSSLNEAAGLPIIVPGTSCKAVNMETSDYAIENGDFTQDGLLNKLLESRDIASKAERCFKTMGSSRFYVHESEVTSYRDLLLKQITEKDRFRATAWVLPADWAR